MKTRISDAELRALAATKTIQEISDECGYHYDTIRHRLKKLDSTPKERKQVVVNLDSVREDARRQLEKRADSQNAKRVKLLSEELIRVEKERDALLSVGEVKTYVIKSSGKEGDKSNATAIVLASDWHYEEPVKKSQVNGLNEFSTIIAKERIEKFFRVTSKLVEVHQREYKIDTLIFALLGDFISGSIHDDLMEANEIQPTQAIWEVQNLIASGIKYLLENTDVKLVIPCSSGNHGRITEKQRIATEFGNSLEILMYRQLESYFENEERVSFIINDSYLTYVKVYDYVCRFSHGHAIKYGGGIGGIFIPSFKAISQWNKSKHADWDFFGHFHQMKDGGNFVTNGSLIGFNSFAIRIKADYERPKQAFIIIDSERGMDVVRKITL